MVEKSSNPPRTTKNTACCGDTLLACFISSFAQQKNEKFLYIGMFYRLLKFSFYDYFIRKWEAMNRLCTLLGSSTRYGLETANNCSKHWLTWRPLLDSKKWDYLYVTRTAHPQSWDLFQRGPQPWHLIQTESKRNYFNMSSGLRLLRFTWKLFLI